MRRDFRLLLSEIGRKVKQEPQLMAADFDRVSKALSKHHIHLSNASVKKLWEVITGKRKVSREALNRLALFAGFQNWQDLSDAIHGDVDASVNYEDDKRPSRAR